MTAVYVIAGYLIVASLISFIPATLARSKGYSFANWWLISMLTVGIFAIIIVAFLPTRHCPQCHEVIHPQATVCRHCGYALPAAAASLTPSRPLTPEELRRQRQFVFGLTVLMLVPITLTAVAVAKVLPMWGAVAVIAGIVITAGMMFAVPITLTIREGQKLSAASPSVTP